MLNLGGVTPFRRLLAALLFPGIFALWLVPTAQAVDGTPSVRAPQLGQPVAALESTPPSVIGALGEAEAPDDDRRGRVRPPRATASTHFRTPLHARPDRATRDRSAGPIYVVRRSGQAHRSAP